VAKIGNNAARQEFETKQRELLAKQKELAEAHASFALKNAELQRAVEELRDKNAELAKKKNLLDGITKTLESLRGVPFQFPKQAPEQAE